MQKIIRIIVVLIVVLLVGWGVYNFTGTASGLIPAADEAASKGYSAVFLANDQVYFGKASVVGDVVVLKDVYYIRLNEAQPQQEGEEQLEPQLSLVKLGDQIHGPADEMRISRDQVLFVERIKDDSTVVQAITKDKESREAKTDETPLTTQQPAQQPAATDQSNQPAETTDQTEQ